MWSILVGLLHPTGVRLANLCYINICKNSKKKIELFAWCWCQREFTNQTRVIIWKYVLNTYIASLHLQQFVCSACCVKKGWEQASWVVIVCMHTPAWFCLCHWFFSTILHHCQPFYTEMVSAYMFRYLCQSVPVVGHIFFWRIGWCIEQVTELH